MGLFDNIDYEGDCPKCGKKVYGFQSKDGPCRLDHLKPEDVNNFYSTCLNCKTWIEFNAKLVEPKEFVMTFEELDSPRQKTIEP